MQTFTIKKNVPAANIKQRLDKRKFIEKLNNAIAAENKIFDEIAGPEIFKTGPHKTPLLNRFIKNIDKSYKRNINKMLLEEMLAEANAQL